VVRRIGAGRTTLAAFLLGGLAQLFIPLAPAEPLAGAAFLIASQLLGDGLITIYSITETSLRQQAVAAEALGRTAAVWKMAASIIAPIGMVLGALLAEYAGIRGAIWVLVTGVIVASAPLVAARRVLEVPPKPR
jgi:MFS family permease